MRRRKHKGYANRGKQLELIIDKQNKLYINRNIAYVRKVPTNVRILGTNNRGQVRGNLMRGYFCDYVGVYKGRMLEFDAKQTNGKSLSFDNVRANQELALETVHKMGGYAFLIVHFKELNRYFRLAWSDYSHIKSNTERKSLSLQHFEEYAHEIEEGKNGILDYLGGLE